MARKSSIDPPQLVMIDWVDSCSSHQWLGLKEYDNKPVEIRSVGWLIADEFHAKTIVGSLSKTRCCSDMTIPSGCIKRMVHIREPRK